MTQAGLCGVPQPSLPAAAQSVCVPPELGRAGQSWAELGRAGAAATPDEGGDGVRGGGILGEAA